MINDQELARVARSVERAPKWRARWQISLIGMPIGVLITTVTWLILINPGPWWHSASATVALWLGLAGLYRLAERWHVRRIERVMPGWKVTKVTTSRATISPPKGPSNEGTT